MMLVEKIRVEEFMNGGMKYPLLCYENLKRELKLDDNDIQNIKNRVEERGPLTPSNIASAVSAFAHVVGRSTSQTRQTSL